MSGRYISGKTDSSLYKIQLSGAKATRLAILQTQGFPVPDFFVINTNAFKKYAAKTDAHSRRQLLRLVRHGIAKYFGSDEITYNLAVRSSAPFEDHAAFSLAGQFKSFLNIYDPDSLVEALIDCWDSMRSGHVQAYLRQFNFSQKRSAMGVIVQKMLQPDYAGVLFTRHPVTGDEKIILIEIVRGVGESLVSGANEPVRLLVERDEPLNIKIYGREEETLFLKENSAFTPFIHNLVKKSLAIEKLFGAPQDIEWACEKDHLWFLQTRPITHTVSRERTKVDTDGNIWTDYFFAERFTEPLSPLGWSILRKWVVKNAFREPLFFLGYARLARQKELAKLIDGYPFTRITVFQQLYAPIPLRFISHDKQTSLLLQNRSSKWLWELIKITPSIVRLVLLKDFNWLPKVNIRQWKKFVRFNKLSLEGLTVRLEADCDPLDVFKQSEELTNTFLALHRWSITFADIFYVILQKFLYLLKPTADCDKLLSDLVSGLENDTVKANRELLNSDHTDTAIHNFLQKYGHRSESLDIYHPCWADDPAMIKTLAGRIYNANKAESARREFIERVNIRRNAENTCNCKISRLLPGYRFMIGYLFHIILYYTQGFTLLRENQRSEWHRILAVMRHSALLYGKQLEHNGILQAADDVFFLTRRELFTINKYQAGIQPLVQQRRQQRDRHLIRDNIQQLAGNVREESGLLGSGRLEGFGVSKGIIRGRAHVARSFREAGQASSDEILVAHSADPAWSPIFSMISGMVLETGGILSHASIVAREFGLPTVTGVARATDVIQTGDWLEINGETGIVQILTHESGKS
ncbi:MAG TPA: PEP/pyruvate-binding domain-containing protein [bacterium]|nr:PEP/pyruvate-binding domain-containing protein [bacterium]HPN43346.1 PEP/pyruvate-binding domain-containing protein [bacterium]